MAWTSMHFAVGMGCAGLAAGAVCLVWRRGLRWIPAAMTAGGLWAIVPDLPRLFREDFPNAPLAGLLGAKTLERHLHDVGNLFCFHASLDAQPRELALHGLALTVLLYNAAILMLLWLERRQRKSPAHRTWHAHQRAAESSADQPHPAPPTSDPFSGEVNDPVIHRIRPAGQHRTGS